MSKRVTVKAGLGSTGVYDWLIQTVGQVRVAFNFNPQHILVQIFLSSAEKQQ